jgi:outer membrane protein assembly factor BamE (lipoprotein component of BamABCDE complex)
MKKIPILLLATLSALVALSGCSTVKSRIEEKSAVFNALDPQTQARIKQGIVDVGFTPDMVYIALGKPDETKESVTANGRETTWIYNEYWQEYQGSRLVGYRRNVYYDPVARAYRVYYEPVEAAVYRNRVEQKIRVMFKDGKVSAIEQAKD